MMADSRLQNADGKSRTRQEMEQRLLAFAAAAMRLVGRLSRSVEGRYVAGQLMRSAASSGANYHEACAAESRADFVHKLQVALKELRESEYWLRLAAQATLLPSTTLSPLQDEADQLIRIIAKSVVTAKSHLS
jgi:four helix bundle protein